MGGRLAVFAFSLLAALFCCCGEEESAPAAGGAGDKAFEVRHKFGAGPVKFVRELSAGTITTADALLCRLTLDVSEEYEAEFPELVFPDDVPGAILTDFDVTETVKDGRRVQVCDYELEPEYEGTLKFPAMEVYYHRKNEVAESILEIEPTEVTVKAAPVTDEMLAFKPAAGLVTVEEIEAARRRVWPVIVWSVVGALVAVAIVVYLIRRPRKAPPPPPAHEVALGRLKKLAEMGWISRGLVEPFFVEVTGIVRDYIESAFGLRAPEQTTEEFLAGMVDEPAVARHREVLQPFLAAADQVKFACLVPDEAAMQRAFDTASDFVRQTANTDGGAR